jgi:hypothetical protein
MHRDREIHDNLGEHDELQGSTNDDMPLLFRQPELNDFICKLNLPKDAADVLGSRLKAKNLPSCETNFSWYRHHERDPTYFSEDGSVLYCKDISGMISWFGLHYSAFD